MSPIERGGGGGGGGTPIGFEFDYVEITANVTITSNNPAAPTDVITGNSVTYDGATRVRIEFYCPVIEDGASNASVAVDLWDGATHLCEICGTFTTTGGLSDFPGYGVRLLTPSAAAHTYKIRASHGGATNGLIAAGNGSGGNFAPAFMRITKA